MSFDCKVKNIFDSLVNPTPQELKVAIELLDLKLEDLHPYIVKSDKYPYGRKLIYQSEHVEVLVMNWNDGIECSPHDHGDSYGWIVILSGETTHSLYKINSETGMPVLQKRETTKAPFFTHKKQVHAMVNNEPEPLVTFHVYSLPIKGMKVYDLHRCAACIVSDDCGAWWPDEQRQLIREIQLSKEKNDAIV